MLHERSVYAAHFSPDGKSLLITGPGQAHWRHVPLPWRDPAERLRLWLEVNTGLELDAGGAVVDLDAPTWRQRWERLQRLGGPPR